MTRDPKHIIDEYWAALAREQNYSAALDYYLPHSVLIDPIYGRFDGFDAIKGFLEMVTAEMANLNVTFEVRETAGAGNVGWSQWIINLPDGETKDGVSVYRFEDDRIAYQRDYVGGNELM